MADDEVHRLMSELHYVSATPVVVDGDEFTLLQDVYRHPRIGTSLNPITASKLLSRVEYHAPIAHYRLTNANPILDSRGEPLKQHKEATSDLLRSLYGFAFETTWFSRFVPKAGLNVSMGQGSTVMAALPEVNAGFRLREVQKGEGGSESPEYGDSRRGKPCGHVFGKGEGVYHCANANCDLLFGRVIEIAESTPPAHFVSDASTPPITKVTTSPTPSTHPGVAAATAATPKPGNPPTASNVPSTPPRSDSDEAAYQASAASKVTPLPDGCRTAIEEAVVAALDFMLLTLERSPEESKPPTDPEAIKKQLSRAEETYWNEAQARKVQMENERLTKEAETESDDEMGGAPSGSGGSMFGALGKSGSGSGWASLWRTDKGKGRSQDTATPPSAPRIPSMRKPSVPLDTPMSEHSTGSSDLEGTVVAPWGPKRGAGPWAVILWNDEKHSYAQVIDQVVKATSCKTEDAFQVALRVDNQGRDIITITNDVDKLFAASKLLSDIDLGVTVRSAHDTFAEQACDFVIDFLLDIVASTVYGVAPGEEDLMKQIVAEKICEEPMDGSLSRFQRLLLSDVKLWKGARSKVKNLYVSLLALSPEVKTQMGVLFAGVYPQLVEYNLLVDREAEHTILYFSIQIITVPSIVALLVTKYNFLDTLLDLLFSFFTGQVRTNAEGRPRHIILPPDYLKSYANPESPAFRHKRYHHLFHELTLVLGSPGVQAAIAGDLRYLKAVLRFITLFTNMNPNKRAVDEHVEFESDSWVAAFNLTIQLAKLARAFGECYAKGSQEQIVEGAALVVRFIAASRLPTHHVQFGTWAWENGSIDPRLDNDFELVKFQVDKAPVSFHHPVNWLLAEIFRSFHMVDFDILDSPNIEGLGDVLMANSPFFEAPNMGNMTPLAVGENVLRVFALLAQARSGLWVRNGFAVRAQQLHYREYSLRENTFDQDLLCLQAVFSGFDQSHVLVAMVDRFGLRDWFHQIEPPWEPAQTVSMLEELLYFIIATLSETAGVTNWPKERQLRREIIHALCLGPLSYSDVVKRVPDRFVVEGTFDKALAGVGDFKEPTGTNETGTFRLKPELLAEVDPFHYRFGRNQREDAEKLVLAHLEKTTGSTVWVPTRLDVQSGPFRSLPGLFTTKVLVQVIFSCLSRFDPASRNYSEYLAENAIHLVMMGLVEQPQAFGKLASELKFALDVRHSRYCTLAGILRSLETPLAGKPIVRKIRWCLDQLVSNGHIPAPATIAGPAKPKISPAEAKKAEAKARQAAIMNQFAAAQQAFLNMNDIDDEDDEDEEETAIESEGPALPKATVGSCIVCQRDLKDGDSFGALGFVQSSKLARYTSSDPEHVDWLRETLEMPSSLDTGARSKGTFGVAGRRSILSEKTQPGVASPMGFPADHHKPGMYTSACGHLMHLTCFDTYYVSVERRHHNHPFRNHPENLERYEFLCPLCKSIGNVFLPLQDSGNGTPRMSMDDGLWSFVGGTDEDTLDLTHKETAAAWTIGSTQEGGTSGSDTGISPNEWTMLNRFIRVTTGLGSEISGGSAVQVRHDSDLVGYTLACIEISTRGNHLPQGVFTAITEPQKQTLQSLVGLLKQLVCASSNNSRGIEMARKGLAQRLRYGLRNESLVGSGSKEPLILHDPIGLIVQCAAVAPAELGHTIAIAYYLEVVRTLLGLARICSESTPEWWKAETGEDSVMQSEVEGSSEGRWWKMILTRCLGGLEITDNPIFEMDVATLQRLLASYTLPFLRRAALLYNATGNQGKSEQGMGVPDTLADAPESARLMWHLSIPLVNEVFTDNTQSIAPDRAKTIGALVFNWFHHYHTHLASLASSPSDPLSRQFYLQMPRLEHPTIYELLGLPREYNDLLTAAATNKCETCGQVPDEPALCLLCGKMLCMQSFCCMSRGIMEEPEYGECNMHMWGCGGSIAVLLAIKKCSLVYLATETGAFASAPYLDDHGEVDFGLKRGRPLKIHQARWEEARKLWLGHGIPTYVARKHDSGADVGGWQTF